MNKTEFQSGLIKAFENGTLLTPKHNPNQLTIEWKKYRSVLSFDLAANLEGFLKSGQFKVTEYENFKYPKSPAFFLIEPDASSSFSVPASGVPAYSPYPSAALKRLVAVSGIAQGFHLFGEDSANVERRVTTGDLIRKSDF